MVSLNVLMSPLTLSTNAFILALSSSGEAANVAIANLNTPSLSRYSEAPTMSLTAAPTSLITVPVFALGIRPLGPRILATPAFPILLKLSSCARHLSNSILPSFTASNTVSSPTTVAPAVRAASAWTESGGQMTHMRRPVFTGYGRLSRLRTTGPFLRVRRRRAISYFGDVGGWPTSKARMYLHVAVSFLTLSSHHVVVKLAIWELMTKKSSSNIPHRIDKRELVGFLEIILFKMLPILLLFRCIRGGCVSSLVLDIGRS